MNVRFVALLWMSCLGMFGSEPQGLSNFLPLYQLQFQSLIIEGELQTLDGPDAERSFRFIKELWRIRNPSDPYLKSKRISQNADLYLEYRYSNEYNAIVVLEYDKGKNNLKAVYARFGEIGIQYSLAHKAVIIEEFRDFPVPSIHGLLGNIPDTMLGMGSIRYYGGGTQPFLSNLKSKFTKGLHEIRKDDERHKEFHIWRSKEKTQGIYYSLNKTPDQIKLSYGYLNVKDKEVGYGNEKIRVLLSDFEAHKSRLLPKKLQLDTMACYGYTDEVRRILERKIPNDIQPTYHTASLLMSNMKYTFDKQLNNNDLIIPKGTRIQNRFTDSESYLAEDAPLDLNLIQ